MKYKNSFFRLDIRQDGTYLIVYPAISDGKPLEINEVLGFLDSHACTDYSKKDLKDLIDGMGQSAEEMKVCNVPIPAFNESAKVYISPDKMVAYMRFYPPSTGGKLMTKKEILTELEPHNISYGISEKVIDVFLMARQYCLNIPIAKGQKPVLAQDTVIEYCFNTKPLSKPKMLEDGSVDFHELNLFTNISKGQVLAKLIPHTMGEPGRNILGEEIQPNKPKVRALKYGRNISISEDKTVITSNVDGNVTLTDDTVFVSDTYNVAADVDASTGDINYDGSVMIPGNVRTGFTVRAKGDIQVNGVVEGATLIAGGNIVIKRGVQGLGKGTLEAGGDICAQFFESANVSAKGDVMAGSILHSNVNSGGKIVVSGRKGFIVGGEIICQSYVEVNSIGNKMETQTIIKVGVNPELYEEMKVLVSEASEINGQIEEIESYINVYKTKVNNGGKLSPENIKLLKDYNTKLVPLKEEYDKRNNRLQEIKKALEFGKKGSIKVSGNTYRGVTMYIASAIYIVKDKDVHSWYKIVDGDIRPTSF